MKKRTIRFSIKNQLVLFLALFILIILLSDVLIFMSFGKSLRATSVQMNSKTLEMIRSDAENQIRTVETLAESLRRETCVNGYVSRDYSAQSPEQQILTRHQVMQKLFDAVMLQSSTVTNCCLIRNEEEYIIQNPNAYGLINDSFIQAALAEIGGRQSARIISVRSGGTITYCYYFPIYPSTDDAHSKLVFVLNERMFDSIFNKYRYSNEEMLCLDENANVFYHSMYRAPALEREDLGDIPSNSIQVTEEPDWLQLETRITNTPFYLHLRIPYDTVMQNMYTSMKMEIIFVAVTIVILSLACFYFSRRLYKRINELQNMMNHVANGELDYRYESRKSDEISDIGYTINTMVDRINSLVVETSKKELAVKKAQFRSVQMQINPHFLFNTLETIRMMALYHNESPIARVVKDLSDLFRYTIVSTNPIVSINDELNHTLKYLDLQKNRAKNQFNTEIDVDPIALDYALLRLMLQPLVENAITHGIEPKYLHCNLKISIHLENDMIRMSVEDSGVGIPQEKLEILRKKIRGEIPSEQKDEHIGLHNVHERLKLFFGEESEMLVESTANVGTQVTLRFPAIRYNEKMTAEELRGSERKPTGG